MLMFMKVPLLFDGNSLSQKQVLQEFLSRSGIVSLDQNQNPNQELMIEHRKNSFFRKSSTLSRDVTQFDDFTSRRG